tara:strand:+ start:86 stop:448 length:363 start_codon:yes stop_codon:yes gene_type:complete
LESISYSENLKIVRSDSAITHILLIIVESWEHFVLHFSLILLLFERFGWSLDLSNNLVWEWSGVSDGEFIVSLLDEGHLLFSGEHVLGWLNDWGNRVGSELLSVSSELGIPMHLSALGIF